jgi:hypothetical protein
LLGAYLALEFAVHRSLVRLVDLEFTHQREAWIADGRPQGGSKTRGDLSFWFSYFARQIVGWKWLLSTPAWLPLTEGGPEALRRYRTLWWLSLAGLAVLAFYAVFSLSAA